MVKRLLLALLLSASAFGQAWSGLIDSSRAIDWTKTNGIPGGIPSRSTVCSTVTPSGDTTGSTDTTNINNAIALCPANQIVSLAAGTFYALGFSFGNPNAVNNVTVRGAGPASTKIIMVGLLAAGCGPPAYVCIQGSTGSSASYAGSTSWTAGYSQGSTVLSLGSTAGLSTSTGASGNIVILDQRNDAFGICPTSGGVGNCSGKVGASELGTTVTINTTLPHGFSNGNCVGVGNLATGYNTGDNLSLFCNGKPGWFSISNVTSTSFQYTVTASGLANSGGSTGTYPAKVMVDNGGIDVTEVHGAVVSQNATIGRKCPDAANTLCSTGESSQRDQLEIKRVTDICVAGTWQVAGTACSANTIKIDPPVENTNWRTGQGPGLYWTGSYAVGDGVENMTLDYSSEAYDSSTNNLVFNNAYESWVRNVRSISGQQSHIEMQRSARINIQDNYLYGSKGGASQSYGVLLFAGTSDDLIQNNLCQRVNNCILFGGSWGSVVGYNFGADSSHADTLLHPLMSANHDFDGMVLTEGNNSPGDAMDITHGNSTQMTFFRNRFRGQDVVTYSSSNIPFQVSIFNRAVNVIGNILGTPSFTTAYQCGYWGACSSAWPIYQTGIQDGSFTAAEDPVVATSLLRWGNYDVVTGATRWCGDNTSPGWGTICQGVQSASYVSGGTITGNLGGRCGVTFAGGGGTGATGYVYLSGNGTLGSTINIASPGMNYTSAPTTATLSNGASPWAATCSGTITVTSTVGGVSEVPTSSIAFINGNTVPSCTNTGCFASFASLYLASQPSWWSTPWGTPKWPPIGPDVTSGNNIEDASGHSDMIPAQLAYQNEAIDPAYQLTNTPTGGSWSGGTATLAGTFSARTWDTVSITNASGFNGLYKLTSSNTPYQPGKFCTTSACTAFSTQGPQLSASSGSNPPAGKYFLRYTYVNGAGETLASHRTPITTVSGTQAIIGAPPAVSDAAIGNATGWNCYSTLAGGTYYYKQNASPLPLDGSTTCQINTAIDTSHPGIPLTPTATGTQIAYPLTNNPGISFPVSGVVAYPNVRAFDANIAYGVGSVSSAQLSPSLLTFGNQNTNTWASQIVTLSNNGTATLNISNIALTTGTVFANTGSGTCATSFPTTLVAGASCTIQIQFLPTAVISYTDTLVVTDDSGGNAGSTQTVSMTGTGISPSAPVASFSPSPVPFGTQTTKSAITHDIILSNTGTALLHITSLALTTGTVFTVSANTCGTTLSVNSSCDITIRFLPTAATSYSDTLTLTSPDISPVTDAISGAGIVPSTTRSIAYWF